MYLEKEMATHSSVLAWRIPGTEEPGGLSSRVAQSWTRLKPLSSSTTIQCMQGLFNNHTSIDAITCLIRIY